jgi:hypothetical protein
VIDRMATWDDERLATALGSLATDIAWPSVTPGRPDPALRARVALTERGAMTRPAQPARRRSMRWALTLAIIALLAIAAIAGAAILGLPGLRLTLGDPGTPPPTATVARPSESPGADLELGAATTVDEARDMVGRDIALPADPTLGPPDAVYVDRPKGDAVALVWAPTAALPATLDPGVGLIVQTFDGTIHRDYFEKIVGGGATIEPVTVDGHAGYWISGAPHLFFFNDAQGRFIDDARRWVGDALVWSDGTTTYRIESALGRDATIVLAESLE